MTSGRRLVLTYNLTRTQRSGPNSAQTVVDEKEGLQNVFRAWNYRCAADQTSLRNVIYILDHKYSQANLKFHSLKGHDAVLGRLLAAVCEKEAMIPLLATMSSKETYNEHDEEEDHEFEYGLENLTGLDGKVMLHSATMELSELVQEGHLDRMPDEDDVEETGNEASNITNFYRDTGFINVIQGCYH